MLAPLSPAWGRVGDTVDLHGDERPDDSGQRGRRFGAADEYLFEIVRLGNPFDEARPDPVFPDLLDRLHEIAGEVVHALVHFGEPRVRCPPGARNRHGHYGRGGEGRGGHQEREGGRAHDRRTISSSVGAQLILAVLFRQCHGPFGPCLRDSTVSVGPELHQPARHRHGRVEVREWDCRHLEGEPAVEEFRVLASRLRQDQEELIRAA